MVICTGFESAIDGCSLLASAIRGWCVGIAGLWFGFRVPGGNRKGNER